MSRILRMRHRTVSAQVTAARAFASPTLGPLLVELAELRTELGLPREASVLLDEAERLCDVSGELLDRIDAARVSTHASVAEELRERGELDAAIARYEEALPLARRLEDREAQAHLAFEIARCHHNAGRPEDAAPWFEEARRRCVDCEDTEGATLCTWLTAEMKRRIGEHEAARALYEEAARGFESSADGGGEHLASCLRSLGRTHRVLGNDAAALPAFERAVAISRARGDRVSEAWALLEIGWLKADAGERFHASARFLEAEQRFAAAGEKEGLAYACDGLGRIAWLDDRNEAAIAFLDRAIALYEELGVPALGAPSFGLKARALHDLHRHVEAAGAFAHAAALCRSTGEWRHWLENRRGAFGERVLAAGHRIGLLGNDGPRRHATARQLAALVAAAGAFGFATGLVATSWGEHPGRATLPMALLGSLLVTIGVIRWINR